MKFIVAESEDKYFVQLQYTTKDNMLDMNTQEEDIFTEFSLEIIKKSKF